MRHRHQLVLTAVTSLSILLISVTANAQNWEWGGYNYKRDGGDPYCIFCFTEQTIEGDVYLSDPRYKIYGNDMNREIPIWFFHHSDAPTYDDGFVRIENERHVDDSGLVIFKYPDHIHYKGTVDAWTGHAGHLWFRITVEGRREVGPNLGGVSYQADIQNIGWQNIKVDGQVAGTTGRSLRLEALKVMLRDDRNIFYQGYVAGQGWQGEVSNGAVCGTTGQSRALEAIRVRVSRGHIYYTVHIGGVGWAGPYADGDIAGIYGHQLEAVQFYVSDETPTPTPTVANTVPGVADAGDLALNLNPGTPSNPNFPNPFESDQGWGGGARPQQMIDGLRGCDDPSGWACGLAFTGGDSSWGGEVCGVRQATVDLGTPEQVSVVKITNHGDNHTPKIYQIQTFDDAAQTWVTQVSITNNTQSRCLRPPDGSAWWCMIIDEFSPVLTSKVRYTFNNCPGQNTSILPGQGIIHGWIYEFEIYGPSPPPTAGSPGPTVTPTPTAPTVSGVADPGDLALNLNPGTPSNPNFPNPFESDQGWGGGARPQQITDGLRGCNDPSGWACGLAFTGGDSNWAGQVCGVRQATIDLGTPEEVSVVKITNHGDDHTPQVYQIQTFDDATQTWVTQVSVTNNSQSRCQRPAGSGDCMITDEFSPVLTGKVRYTFNNCPGQNTSIVPGHDIIHGWIYEFEVYGQASPANSPTPPNTATPSATLSATTTATLTRAPTRTLTPTGSQTYTPTQTRTASPSLTPTQAQTPTRTSTSTPTATPTGTRVPTGVGVAGLVSYYSNGQAVAGVLLERQCAAPDSTRTDAQGQYEFPDGVGQTCLIIPQETAGVSSGVSVLDAVYVLQAVVGQRTFSDEQRLACDVDGDGRLTALDAVRILQFIVGLVPRLPVARMCGSDWVFVPVPAPVPHQTVIPPVIASGTCQPGAISYDPLTGPADNQDFRAIAFGDCSGNWQPSAGGAAALWSSKTPEPRVRVGRMRRGRSGQLRLPVYADASGPIHTLDFQLRYDPAQLRVLGARGVGPARNSLVVFNDHVPGLVRIVMATWESIEIAHEPILAVQFDDNGQPATARSAASVQVVEGSQDRENSW